LLSPFLLLVAIRIKLDSPGPVFYVQERMGLDARSFLMFKFRSMRLDAEANGPGWTVKDDPRRTRIGAILRRYSIDELPNLVNGLRGDTSIYERTKYDLWYIENWSVWLDIKILIRTLFRFLFDRNAY